MKLDPHAGLWLGEAVLEACSTKGLGCARCGRILVHGRPYCDHCTNTAWALLVGVFFGWLHQGCSPENPPFSGAP